MIIKDDCCVTQADNCVPGIRRRSFWVFSTERCAVNVIEKTTVAVDCTSTVAYELPDGSPYVGPVLPEIEPPQLITGCVTIGALPPAPAPAPAPVTASGVDCAGAIVSATAVGVVQTVPHPTAVQLVKLCTAPGDRELEILCAPNGDRIILQYDVQTSPPTLLSAFNLATNSAYVGAIDDLTACVSEAVDFGAPINYCAGGVEYTRTDVFDTTTQAVIASIWQDDTGAVVAAPAGPIKGTCAALGSTQVQRFKLYSTAPGVGGLVTPFIRTFTTDQNGVTTLIDTLPDGVTPYVPDAVSVPLDEEYLTSQTLFTACVDNLPSYSKGDTLQVSFVTEAHNITNPKIINVTNQSNGTFPAPFYLNIDGTDVIGTPPVFSEFCAYNPPPKQDVEIFAVANRGIIAGPTRAATAAFTGSPAAWSSSVIPATDLIQTIIVSAKGVTDGSATADMVIITVPGGGEVAVMNNTAITYSITTSRDRQVLGPIDVEATGNAYAFIAVTTVAA